MPMPTRPMGGPLACSSSHYLLPARSVNPLPDCPDAVGALGRDHEHKDFLVRAVAAVEAAILFARIVPGLFVKLFGPSIQFLANECPAARNVDPRIASPEDVTRAGQIRRHLIG
jgi:hypothetical protein